ncbi:hypothetical protein RHSIM_Rhsim09G0200000 [Rhododendron simsii]|uniref:GRF-type domain-containing protein n=1 Tax=Rhododendron simsii TaxID=118357 RepID=A0A834LBW2_RHOSS|nr:hypothetical protein RHSIM_Rhsim09G0200000 [Rhododendron simsii]
MASNMSSSNSGSMHRVCGRCGSGPCVVKTSRSLENPGRRYFKCPMNPPCDKWNGWCDESLPSNASVPRSNETHVVPFELPTVIPTLIADIANLRAENREILNSHMFNSNIVILFASFNIREDMVSPRKRMNLGKKVAPIGSHRLGVVPPGPYRTGRANWDSQMTRLFLQLAIKEIEAEGRGTTQLSNNSLRNISNEISTRTGAVINLKQCKNRYGVLKRDWQAWILLADSRRGATGLGMNPVTGTFTAPDHFWANLIAQNENVAKFRDRPLDHEDLMQRVFEEVTATGSMQCTPGAEGELGMGADGRRALATDTDYRTDTDGLGNTVGVEEGEEICSESTSTSPGPRMGTPFCSQLGAGSPHFPHHGGTTNPFSPQHGNRSRVFVPHHADINTPPFPTHAATHTTSFQQHPTISPPSVSQHDHGTSSLPFSNRGTTNTPPCPQPDIRCSPLYLNMSMTNILETMVSRQNQYKSVIKHGCNMVDVMKILSRMEYFQQEPVPPVYWWLVDYLSGDPTKMDVFYGLPNDEQRISFAQREHTKAVRVVHTYTDLVNSTGVMDNSSWGNSGSADDIGRGTFDLGSFTRLFETGVLPDNYPNFYSRNGGNELPNCNYHIAHQQSNEVYQNGEGYENMPWVTRFATTGQGDVGPSENVPCVQQFVAEYNSPPQLVASSDFRHNGGNGTEPQAGYDNWDDEFYAEIAQDDLLDDMATVSLLNAIHILRKPQRLPFHTCPLSGKAYLYELMNGRDERFQRELCMPKDTFAKIVIELQTMYGWSSSRMKVDGVDCFESFAMFMHLLRGHSNRRTQERFQHSGDTVSRHVHKILVCMKRGFTADKLKPTRRPDQTHEYLDRRNFYKPFKGNCIGAIDGTHVMIRCKKKEDEKRFFSRKGYATQNIMAVCDFDLTFVFASAGWEGTYHDYSIFKRCVLNPRYRFPTPDPGKYYLVDAGYPNRLGFLAPYKGFRYHQPEFRRGQRQPRDDREHFNRAHSSLRSIIERTFGVWKNRFGFLALMPWYDMPTQVDLVLASMAIHNYIRRDRQHDNFFAPISSAYEYAFEDLPDEDPELEDRLDDRDDIVDEDNVPEMNDVRNNIRRALHRLRRRGNRAG